MSAAIYGQPGEELVGKLVTSPDPSARAFGRLIATGCTDPIQQWLHAEIDRGTEPSELIVILTRFSVQLVGAVALTTVRPGHEEALSRNCGEAFGKFLAQHLRIAAEMGLKPGRAANG